MRRRTLALLAISACLMVIAAVPAHATHRPYTTSGLVQSFADGPDLGYAISGKAIMVRTQTRTQVLVVARGLIPGMTYGSHVHNAACGDNAAGGHYSFGHQVPGGGALDGSEIWPGPMTADKHGKVIGLVAVGEKAGPDAVSVVIHAPNGPKIACADLR